MFNPIIAEPPQGRAGNARCCANCGRPIKPKRNSRRQRSCSYRCRDEARRARDFADRYPHQAIPRSVENRPLASTACKGDFADRPLPLNILGGYRWPDSVAVDRKVLANIIRAEIGEAVLTEGERS
jgi:hypothetical protein